MGPKLHKIQHSRKNRRFIALVVISKSTSVYIITTHLSNIPTVFLIFEIYYKTFNVIQGTTCVPTKLQLLIPGEKESSQPPLGKLAAL